ncbi:hypothetical protein PHJA_000929700 [Phtheirospermum japonicum]|uniref:Uncharacterized protein n=1 Tax=Phtheirospermum japonicum TaxID=374723 RepID=A0A830BJS7_9LAMI|nr:hypothetical protein PHJA_000929700 [Phtheirospermum japonicum]
MAFNQNSAPFRKNVSWIDLNGFSNLHKRSIQLKAEIRAEEERFCEIVTKRTEIEKMEGQLENTRHVMLARVQALNASCRESGENIRKRYAKLDEIHAMMNMVVRSVMQHQSLLLITETDLEYADLLKNNYGFSGQLLVAPTPEGRQVASILQERNVAFALACSIQ